MPYHSPLAASFTRNLQVNAIEPVGKSVKVAVRPRAHTRCYLQFGLARRVDPRFDILTSETRWALAPIFRFDHLA